MHDEMYMARAMKLAQRGRFTTHPNPNVGCVIVKDGEIVGEGFHYRAGEPHAEVHALRMAGEKARGATAYVTLEPCSHHGRTPPCCEALIAAGVSRVVASMQDPNPQVAGRGLYRLQQEGIDVSHGLMMQDAEALNKGFLKRMRTGFPYIQLKLDIREPGTHALQETFVERFRVLHHQAVADVNAFLLQTIQTTPRHLRIRILHRCDHARNPCRDQRFAARRRPPVMAAGLQRDVGGGTARLLAGHAQGMNLGMRLAGAIVKPLPHDLAIFNDNAPDVRVGMGGKTTALRQLHGSRHVHLIVHELNPVSGRSLRQTL